MCAGVLLYANMQKTWHFNLLCVCMCMYVCMHAYTHTGTYRHIHHGPWVNIRGQTCGIQLYPLCGLQGPQVDRQTALRLYLWAIWPAQKLALRPIYAMQWGVHLKTNKNNKTTKESKFFWIHIPGLRPSVYSAQTVDRVEAKYLEDSDIAVGPLTCKHSRFVLRPKPTYLSLYSNVKESHHQKKKTNPQTKPHIQHRSRSPECLLILVLQYKFL